MTMDGVCEDCGLFADDCRCPTQLTIGSLFSGYGGLDLAVENVFGARTVWVSDIEPGPCKVLAHRFPDAPNLGDITKVDWAQVEPVDIIAGGSPCQDISSAGRMAGMREGTRSNLWQEMREAIRILRPRFVVWENVYAARSTAASSAMESDPGLLGDHPAGVPVLRALGRVLGDLAVLGYDAQWHSLRAADVGAPHRRLRYFILASDSSLRGGDVVAVAGGRDGREGPVGGYGGEASGAVAFLPTPMVGDTKGQGAADMNRHSPQLRAIGALLPTPDVSLGEHNRANGSPPAARRAGGHQVSLADVASHELLPTPNSALAEHDRGMAPEARRASGHQVSLADATSVLLPSPVASPSGNTPSEHLRKKPGREKVTDLAILVENGLLESGGRLLPTPTRRDDKDYMIRREPHRPDAEDTLSRALTVLLPTPNASVVGEKPGIKLSGRSPSDPQVGLADVVLAADGDLLPTPRAQDSNESPDSFRARTKGLQDVPGRSGGPTGMPLGVAVQELLPTPMVGSSSPSAHGQISGQWRDAMSAALAETELPEGQLLPTPRATDGSKGGPNQRGSSGDLMLPSAVARLPIPDDVPLLPTPAVNDMGVRYTPDEWDEFTARTEAKHHNGNGHGKSLNIEALRHGPLLPTPRSQNGEERNALIWERPAGEPQNLENALAHTDVPPGLLPTPRAARGGSTTETAYALGGERVDDGRPQGEVLLPTPSLAHREHLGGGASDRAKLEVLLALGDAEARDEVWEADGDDGLTEVAERLLPTPSVADSTGGHESRGGDRSDELLLKGVAKVSGWGPYAAAINCWEQVTRPAPSPTVVSPGYLAMVARRRAGLDKRPVGMRGSLSVRRKLNPAFAEWMMGCPDGWICDTPGVSDNEALRLAGNGVVAQQAELALRIMLSRWARFVAG